MRGPAEQLWRIRRHLGRGDARSLGRLLGERAPAAAEVEQYLDELRGSAALRDALTQEPARRWLSDVVGLSGNTTEAALRLEGPNRGRAVLLYVTARVLQPEVVIETGCFTGWDSSLLLHALAANGKGRLYTIDLPAKEGHFSQLCGVRGAGLPAGVAAGFLVPGELHARWTLVEADVRDALAPLLDRVGGVDLFFHDSDHTYEHMTWEYSTVWPALRPGGLLVSDDISWNTAFADFARRVGAGPVVHRQAPNVGAIRKPVVERSRVREAVAVEAVS